MSEPALSPRSGLEGVLLPGAYGNRADAPGVTLALRQDLALAYVMVRKDRTVELQRRVSDRFGMALPLTARAVETGGVSFIWAGPGRWLAVTAAETGATFERTLRDRLSDLASVVNQTDGRSVFRISGPKARDVLALGVPIDLDPRVFAPGDTALTLAGHINVHLWQVDLTPTYEFTVFRSFAASFYQGLFAASLQYGLSVRE